MLTTSNGAPIDSLTASMTAGPRGDIVLKDFTLIDHLAAFDRERIPERVVHAKGAGAFGHFTVTNAAFAQHCKASLFSQVGKQTPVAVRFSTVGGESGSADTARDPRGFAIKFYTEQGNWDLVGNNTPIFFLRDPMLFPSFIHTQKRNPATHCKDADAMWDFFSLRPETTHQAAFLFSDRGTPDGYRHMNGYGSHTYKVVSAGGAAVYVKWHLKTDQGIRNLSAEEAGRLTGTDPDYAIRDLYNAIAQGRSPSWTLYVQIMSMAQAAAVPYNPFDVTKVWPHADFPLQEVGRMVLDRNPADYFAEVEQLAFSPAHMVPGIQPSPDKMLQGRLFSYTDTHRHRLGANYQSLPVNCPYATSQGVRNMQRDGPMNTSQGAHGRGGGPNYFPNSFQGPQPSASAAWHADRPSGDVQRIDSGDEDNFTQCGLFFRKVLDAPAQARLVENIAGSLCGAAENIQQRAVGNFAAADAQLGRMLRDKLQQIQRNGRNGGGKTEGQAAKLSPPRTIIKSRL